MEHPAGWLRYFVKEGIVQLGAAEALADAPAAPAKKVKGKKK